MIQFQGVTSSIGWINVWRRQELIDLCAAQAVGVVLDISSLCLLCGGTHSPETLLACVAEGLHRRGHIGWRHEHYAVRDDTTGRRIALIERAAARFLGLATVGAHCNGYVADARGVPSHLWVGKRALNKTTDPGLWDNLVGCGVPWPESPAEAVVREGWEEAGLTASLMRHAVLRNVQHVDRQDLSGRHRQQIHIYDLVLPEGCVPHNVDGEVDVYTLLPIAEVKARLRQGQFTSDAAVVTLDFLDRHHPAFDR